ncbi:MAG: aminopeptidase P family protein, partial [Alphaproteobacteria bacterium]|nr:aminopeptidase P family protein [Alphaproteobacteria bacterium]
GRYTLQAREQVDQELFEQFDHTKVAEWIKDNLSKGDRLGFDPRLHTARGKKALEEACAKVAAELVATESNLVDQVWSDQPARPLSRIKPHPLEYAGESSSDKRARLGEEIAEAGADAAVLTATDSVAWLFNIRGGDVACSPLILASAILKTDGSAEVFVDPRKLDDETRGWLGDDVRCRSEEELGDALEALGQGGCRVLVDPARSAVWASETVEQAGGTIIEKADPCQAAKAAKNETELEGARKAHERDGVALCRFLAWLAREAPGEQVDEITAADFLRARRMEQDLFRDLSFDTISGSGPNGAIVHYRVSEASNRTMRQGELYLVDSGGQYLDGTTDVTRTICIGEPGAFEREMFTRVLKGHIALAEARFPKGTTGHQLDVLARHALWEAGRDFKHGTGHGVGSYLG